MDNYIVVFTQKSETGSENDVVASLASCTSENLKGC